MLKYIENKLISVPYMNKKIKDGVEKYYYNVFVPKLYKSLNRYNFQIFKNEDLNRILNSPQIEKLILSIINNNNDFFNSLDLAVAMVIFNNGTCDNIEVIIDCANIICKTIKEMIKKDKILVPYLKKIDKDIETFNYKIKTNEIEKILSNRIDIIKIYFSKYEERNSFSQIQIFYPSENGSVRWKDDESLIINHNPNKFDIGFFITGFDYKIVNGENLQIAMRDGLYEYFNPCNCADKDIIWAI